MGYAVATGSLEPTWPLALMTMASLCLYHGGMALNDVVDAKQDAIDGRGRPIDQGDVSAHTAFVLGAVLLLGGAFWTVVLSCMAGNPSIGIVGLLLATAILFYNSSLKRTTAGPLLMASCRTFNVLLGVFAVIDPRFKSTDVARVETGEFAAFCNGVYVLGVTVFARDESTNSLRRLLALGFAVGLLGLSLHLLAPWLVERIPSPPNTIAWILFWLATSLFALRGMAAALHQPTPKNIGRGVGIAIQGLVVIDATLAALYAGPVAGLAILALLPVTMLLARWIPQT